MLASPPPHTASTRRKVALGTETVTGVVTIILPMRGATFTITGEPWALPVGAGAVIFGGTSLTAGAAGAGAGAGAGDDGGFGVTIFGATQLITGGAGGGDGGATSGMSVSGKSEIISPLVETLALR